MKIVFFGPPGSGKGTQAKLLADKLNILHLSTGDILRKKLDDGDDLSIQLKEIMSSGNLVSDKLLNMIVADSLNNENCSNGFILDGYPRTIAQSDFLLSFCQKNNILLDFFIDFKIDFKAVEERIINRAKHEERSDDNLDVVKTRLNKYLKETHPVSKLFNDKFTSNYFIIDASKEISEIQKDLLEIVKKGEN
jgi:adenylate kinase